MTFIPNMISLHKPPPNVFLSQSHSHHFEAKSKPSIHLEVIQLKLSCQKSSWRFCVRASNDARCSSSSINSGSRDFKEMVHSVLPAVSVARNNICSKYAVGLCVACALIAIVLQQRAIKNNNQKHEGSVADLVRRGQLRSDRRGISTPLKYEDPFNNPLVKVGKSNSTIEMCGKVYRLAPITLTEEQQSEHQRRRSRAYQWKRPKVFLKEGESVPPDVDPETVRWIPANHPFATTVSDIDQKMAHDNVYQKRGVPSRIKAEHEALQKKLEALQSEHNYMAIKVQNGTNEGDLSSSKSNECIDYEDQHTMPDEMKNNL